MKFRNILLGIALLASGTVNASTVFNPEVNVDGTLENVDFLYVSIPALFTLGLFSASDVGFSTPLLVNTGNSVTFTPNTPGQVAYTATNDSTTFSIAVDANPGGSAAFILGLHDDTNNMWFADNDAPVDISGGDGKAFSVSFNNPNGGAAFGIDLILAPVPPNEVPVPASVWLFGSGLLGLVGIARRKKA